MLLFNTPQLRDIVKKDATSPKVAELVDHIDFLEIADLEANVKEDVEFLKGHPLLLEGTKISGWIYHVENGKVREHYCATTTLKLTLDVDFANSLNSSIHT